MCDGCYKQLLAELFIPADKIERFIENGVCGRDLIDCSDDDLKGPDLQLTAFQVKKLRRELHKIMSLPQLIIDDSAGLDGHGREEGAGVGFLHDTRRFTAGPLVERQV